MKAWSVHSGDSASLKSTELKSFKLKASKASEASVRGLTYAWARFTHNRHTTLYFLSSLIFCILIFLFQLGAWNTNKAAADIASALLTQANLSTTNFAAYDRNGVLPDGRGGTSGILRLCEDVESSRDPAAKCRVVFPSGPSQPPSPTTSPPISITPTATPTVSSGPVPSGVSSTIGTGRMPLPTDATFSADGEIPQVDLQHSHQHHFHNPHRQRSHQPRLHRRYLPHPDIAAFIREASHPQRSNLAPPPSLDSDPDSRLVKRNIVIEQLPGGSLRVVGLRTDPMTPASDPAVQKDVIQVSTGCVQSVKWALQVLRFAGSEDVASVFFQLWVLSMAIMALVNESVPYLLAALATQAVSAIWSMASLAETVNFRADFVRISSGAQGACAGVDLLPSYWQSRTDVQIVMLVFNLLALGISLWLTYRLNSQFNWSVFKRIGASVIINKLYKLVLTLSILIQLTFFFIITSIALWVDQLFRGLFAVKADQAGLYKGISVIALLILLPWLLLGWVSVRRENRTMMLVFLCLSIFYLIVSFALCFSSTFQLTFIYWRFFAVVYVLTFLFVIATIIVGVMCRLNFGRGLPNYLDGQRTPGFGDPAFRPSDAPDNDPEKVAFPSRAKLPQLGTIHRPTGGRQQGPPPPPPVMSSRSNLSTRTPSVRTSMSATAGHGSLRSHPSRHSHVPSSLSSLPRKSIGGDYAPGMGSPVPPPIDTAAAIAGISTRRQDRDRSGSDREGRTGGGASGLSSGGGSRSRKPRPESVMLQRAEMEGLTQDAPRPPPPAFAMPPAPVSVPIVPTPGAAAGGSASEADQGDTSVVLKLGRKTSNLARAPGIRRFARGQQANAEYAAAVAASTAGPTNLVTGSGDLNPFSDGEPTQGDEVDEESSSGRQQKQKQPYDSQSMRAAKVKSFHPSADQPFMSREQMEERMGLGARSGASSGSGNGAGVARQETSSTVASYGTGGHANSAERKMMAAQPTLGHMDPEMSDDSVGGRDWRAGGGRTAPAKAFQKKRTQE